MGRGSLTLLLDTNVWIDRLIPARPRHALAVQLIDLCIEVGVTLLYPMRSLQDVFFQVMVNNKQWIRTGKGELTEAAAHAINNLAWDCVDFMTEVGSPVGADVSDVWVAQHLRDIHPDFEDNMVLAAALRAKVDYLVTSDEQLIKKATVTALVPADMVAVLKMGREPGAAGVWSNL